MSGVSSYLANRSADLSNKPSADASSRLSLPSTYYNGTQLMAAGSAGKTLSTRLSTIGARRVRNQATVSGILSQRKQAKSVADALAEARSAEAAANAQTQGLKDSYTVKAPTGPSNSISLVGAVPHESVTPYTPPPPAVRPAPVATKPGAVKGKPKPGKPAATTTKGSYSGTGIKITGGVGNTSGAAGAIGGVKGAGTYKYTNNTGLSASRNKVLSLATGYLGTTYKLGGNNKTGIDCSGLVQQVYRQLGFKVPTHSAADQGQTGGRNNGNGIPGVRTSVANLRPGDLVAWKDGSHIAIYAGNGKIIESTRTAAVNRGTVYRTLWAPQSAVIGIRVSLPGEDSKAGTTAKKTYADDRRGKVGR